MKQESIIGTFRQHLSRLEAVLSDSHALELHVERAASAIAAALRRGNKLICFGNGGSATQANHFAEELLGRYRSNRRPYPAISLVSDPAAISCIANDFGYEAVFERQLEALAQPGDVSIAFSTSGKSENVLRGLRTSRTRGATTVALTGAAGIPGAEVDHLVAVPATESAHIQELHLVVLHTWCEAVEELDASAGAPSSRNPGSAALDSASSR